MARRLLLPGVRRGGWVAALRWALVVRRLCPAPLGDGRDDLPPDEDPAHGVVCRGLAHDERQAGRLRPRAATCARDRLVPDRVGDAASLPQCDGPSRARPALGYRRGRRDLPRRARAWCPWPWRARKDPGRGRCRAASQGPRAVSHAGHRRREHCDAAGVPARLRRAGLGGAHRRLPELPVCLREGLCASSNPDLRIRTAGARAAPRRPSCRLPRQTLDRGHPPGGGEACLGPVLSRRSLEVGQGMRHVRGSPGLAVADRFS